jgi:hypothetical protein
VLAPACGDGLRGELVEAAQGEGVELELGEVVV